MDSATGILICLLLLSAQTAFPQSIRNSSFEGPIGASVTPPEWEPCGLGSTPDTQPGSWNVTTLPVAGNSYLSMICRGPDVPHPNQWESCGQYLREPIEKGVCYALEVDLARSGGFGSGNMDFTRGAEMRIWGGNSACAKAELLWASGRIDHQDWRHYEMIIVPKKNDYQYLVIESYYSSLPTYSGNILIDNFLLNSDMDPCIKHAMGN